MDANRPSRTAVLVARGIATVAATPELTSLVPKLAAVTTRSLLIGKSFEGTTQ